MGPLSLLAKIMRTTTTGPSRARLLAGTLVLALTVLVVFIAAAIAIVKFSRRYRARLLRKDAPPTQNADVWRMHRLPENWRDEEGTERGE